MSRSISSAVCVLTIAFPFCYGLAFAADAPPKTELAKEAADWHYPDAQVVGTGETNGKMHQAILMTKDDLEKVLGFYEKMSGQKLILKKEETKTGIYLTGVDAKDGESVATMLADDSGRPPDPRKQGAPPRGVIIRLLTQDANKHFVSVMVSHADGEKETHVVVTYLKK
jgi:hypothetical protein